ncbi:MAG: hypothetical protein DRQ56_06935 [Gammaproteobacteria bacterium]|nr:MAG: hypothetical protein DRQ56_06935 [Gammaproteobacteria bacterium]
MSAIPALQNVYKQLPLVMVQQGLRAAIGRDNNSANAEELVSKLTKVSLTESDAPPDSPSVVVYLELWFLLDQGEYYILRRKLEIHDGQLVDWRKIWSTASSFTVEELLRLRTRLV